MKMVILLMIIPILLIFFIMVSHIVNNALTISSHSVGEYSTDTNVMNFYHIMVKSGYIDTAVRLMEMNYNNFYNFSRDYVRIVYLNKYLTNVSREVGVKVKVYVNGTLIFDSSDSNLTMSNPTPLEVNSTTELSEYLNRYEDFIVLPYISESGQYYRIYLVVTD